MAKRDLLTKNTPVYNAFALNLQTGQFDRHIGIGTREVIAKHGLRSDGIVHWCSHAELIDGWMVKKPSESKRWRRLS